MNKQFIAVITVLAIGGVVLFTNIHRPVINKSIKIELPTITHSISFPSLNVMPIGDSLVVAQAWTTLKYYLEFAHTHNLAGIKSLSYQTSSTCNDTAKESECFALMDNVYELVSVLKLEEFKYVQIDERQIVMYTDGPIITILYFIRDKDDIPKILGLRFCYEYENMPDSCAKNITKNDANSDGWWDSIESLFY